MKKLNLQLFAEAVKGSKLIYLYRILEEAATEKATVIMFSTEDTLTMSKDADSTATKDGAIRTPGEMEIEKSGTSILSKGDTMYDKLVDAMKNNKIIEMWEVNLEEPATEGEGKFKGTYYQGYLTELEKSSSAEDFVECSTTIAINGTGVDGDVTVTAEQQAAAAYVFKDTTAAGA
jgi:TP901-1 family phage major tail protein